MKGGELWRPRRIVTRMKLDALQTVPNMDRHSQCSEVGIISIISIPESSQISGEREAPSICAAVAGQWPEPMSATMCIIQVVKFCLTCWYTAMACRPPVLPLTTTCTPIIPPLRRQSWLAGASGPCVIAKPASLHVGQCPH